MTDTPDRVPVACPSCSPDVATVHEVLSTGGDATVRCTECDHVHKTRIERETTVRRDVVVSQEDESFSATVEVPTEETLAVGEEFVLETDQAILTVRITSLELGGDGGRAEEAAATDVATIWTRDVGNLAVNVTLHPTDGTHDETRSVELYVPGDYEFTVGETESMGDTEFEVEGIAVRDDAVGYDHKKVDHEGDTVLAKDVTRVYGREDTRRPWSAW